MKRASIPPEHDTISRDPLNTSPGTKSSRRYSFYVKNGVEGNANAPATPEELLELRFQIVEAKIAEVRGEIEALKQAWRTFVPAVAGQVSQNLLIPLLNSIQLPDSLKKELFDPLNLDNI